MKILFMGTSAFAVPSLVQMVNSPWQLVGIISQPDRPRGRGNKLGSTPVKQVAMDYGYEVCQFTNIKQAEAEEWIRAKQPDLIVVVSYGQIIPAAVLDIPRCGCLNVHASLLPEYRGAAPVQRALMNGDEATGVTIMFMDPGLDTGDIFLQEKIPIENNITHGELETQLAHKGAEMLVKAIELLEKGGGLRTHQNNDLASYAAMIGPDDERIDWRQPALAIYNRIRALNPSPGAYSTCGTYRIKIFASRLLAGEEQGLPGEIKGISRDGFLVQTGQGILEILEVQKEGKKRMTARDFIRGVDFGPGSILNS